MSLPSIQLVDEAPRGFGTLLGIFQCKRLLGCCYVYTGLQGNALFVVYYDVMPNEILGRKRKSI
ncbi:hypothetical protein Peur_045707 [Populus x canadensis]|jgi:hypothetical protein